MVENQEGRSISLSPCLHGYEQSGCFEYLLEKATEVAKPTRSIVVAHPTHMQPLFTEESWVSFWDRKFGQSTFPFSRFVFDILDRYDAFPGDGFLDISDLPNEGSADLFDSIRPDTEESEEVMDEMKRLVSQYRFNWLDVYYVKKVENQLVGVTEAGYTSAFHSDTIQAIWDEVHQYYPDVEMVRVVVDRQTYKGRKSDPLNGDRMGNWAIQSYDADPRVTGGLGVYEATREIERLPYSTRMAGFSPSTVDTTVMVISALIVILAMFSGKRGNGGAQPVVAIEGQSPLHGRPTTLQLPISVIETIANALGGRRQSMPTIYLAEGKVENQKTIDTKPAISKTTVTERDPTVKRVPFLSESGQNQATFARLLAEELVDHNFVRDRERLGSVIKEPYRELLDPFYNFSYPMNCVGTYARTLPDYLESFVNIGRLMDLVSTHTKNDALRTRIETSDINEFRRALRSAMHAVGDLSYEYEWTDTVTYSSIDTLLESMAAYRTKNKHIAELLKGKLPQYYREQNEVVVLDIGSGVGGTSIEMMRLLEQLKTEGEIPLNYRERTRLILFDLSEAQLVAAREEILKQFGPTKVDLIKSNFRNLDTALEGHRGKVDVIVSGAAICHITEKSNFFDQVNSIMRPGGAMSFWDPAISQYQGDYIREGKNGEVRILFETADGGQFTIKKGELLDIGSVAKLKDKKYTTIVEVPPEEIAIFAYSQQLHLFQMGYSEANIGAEQANALMMRLHQDISVQTKTSRGFSLLEWYETNLVSLPYESAPDQAKWTPYDLIEAVETKSDYENYIRNSGFKLTSSGRFSDLENVSDNVADKVVVFYLIEK